MVVVTGARAIVRSPWGETSRSNILLVPYRPLVIVFAPRLILLPCAALQPVLPASVLLELI